MVASLATNPFPKQRAQVSDDVKKMRAALRRWGITAKYGSRLVVFRESATQGYVTDAYALRIVSPGDADWDVFLDGLEVGECRRITKKGHDAITEECEPPSFGTMIDANVGTDPIDDSKTRAYRYTYKNGGQGYVFTTVGGIEINVAFDRVKVCVRDGDVLKGRDPLKAVSVFRDGVLAGLMMPIRGIPSADDDEIEWAEVGG